MTKRRGWEPKDEEEEKYLNRIKTVLAVQVSVARKRYMLFF